ncbi:MAG: hypothetical protein LBF77_05875 [Spirochaetaceae bacterium]|nr:hypothetical protein [Spirochaetaceae bacterium]
MERAQKFTIDPHDPPTFEKVWKMFQESDKKLQETWEQIKATDRQMKETDKKVGELTNRFGTVVEHMIVPNLLAKFKDFDFTFEVAHKNTEIKDEKNKIFVEVDVFLENGDKVMIVEIKATPTVKDVNEHIARMEKLRKYADLRKDNRKYLGAIAGVVTSDSVKTYALKKGFFVIVPSGDTFNITKPEGKYQVKEW